MFDDVPFVPDDVDRRCSLLYIENTTKRRVPYGSSSTLRPFCDKRKEGNHVHMSRRTERGQLISSYPAIGALVHAIWSLSGRRNPKWIILANEWTRGGTVRFPLLSGVEARTQVSLYWVGTCYLCTNRPVSKRIFDSSKSRALSIRVYIDCTSYWRHRPTGHPNKQTQENHD